MNKIKEFFRRQKEAKICPLLIIHFFFVHQKYGTCIEEYFENNLYALKENHRNYYENTTVYQESWKVYTREIEINKSRLWLTGHYLQFGLYKILYPGLTAQNYLQYHFYEISHSKRKTFITEGKLEAMDAAFNGRGDKSLVGDKKKFNELFKDYIGRRWLFSETMTLEDLRELARKNEKLIIKPYDGIQGAKIEILDVDSEEKIKNLYEKTHTQKYMIEEVVKQHHEISKLNPSSVNTLRIYSVMTREGTVITSAVIRIGRGDKPTDNYSAGGMAAAIDLETGKIISPGVDKKCVEYKLHPTTGETISGKEIPSFKEALTLVKEGHKLILKLRYIAWDVAIKEDGTPVFIEANTMGGVRIQQQLTQTGMKDIYKKLL